MGRIFLVLAATLMLGTPACQRSRSGKPPRAINVLMWTSGSATDVDARLIADFTRKTGIAVSLIPASESSSQRLKQELALVSDRSADVDVLQIDMAWLAQLRDHLTDVRAALQDRLADELPGTVENATSPDGRVVAAPFMVGYGLLFYRTDLLRRYGFSKPPATWDELEGQSRAIQAGERAAGHSEFWGYVWEGAEYEGLTCNALEWQSSQGGGVFVDSARQPNVNTAQTEKAFARAASWVNTISPPGVVAYVEEDARNVWQSGNAAFMRNWAYVYPLARRDPHLAGRLAVAPLPSAGPEDSSTLGGWYLGIPKTSRRQKDAEAFVRFFASAPVQINRAQNGGFWPTLSSAYRDPALNAPSSVFRVASRVTPHLVRRPAALLGQQYPCASEIYFSGVHDVLTGRLTASQATRQMDLQLTELLNTGRSRPFCP